MIRHPVVTASLGIALLALLAAWQAGPLAAQEGVTATPEPTVTPTAYPLQGLRFSLLAQADVAVATDGPTVVRVASLVVLPGQVSIPFTNEGPTVLVAQSGVITVQSDRAVVGVADISMAVGLSPIEGTPGPIDGLVTGPGQQITLPAGATTTISNQGAAPASVLILAVLPAAAPASAATPVP